MQLLACISRFNHAYNNRNCHDNDLELGKIRPVTEVGTRRRRIETEVSSVVDDCSNADDVANLFSTKYQDLYTSVSYDESEMMP